MDPVSSFSEARSLHVALLEPEIHWRNPAGIRHAYRDRLVAIPMFDPGLRSLNVSTCMGIALYEVLRQRRSPPGTSTAS